MTFHKTEQSYRLAYKVKSVVPSYTMYYVSRVLGTKNFKNKTQQFKQAVDQCLSIKEELSYYTGSEWIFDCSKTQLLINFMKTDPLRKDFNLDIKGMKWRDYARNFGFGIKHYILHELSVVPSHGYKDAVLKMDKAYGWWPLSQAGLPLANVKSRDEMRKLLLSTESVKEAMAQIVAEKLKYYQGTL
jgi:hypothetical protein